MKNEIEVNSLKILPLIDKAKLQPTEWGQGCQSWYLLDKDTMGIFHEIMPPDTTDKLHLHHFSEQFVYVLRGVLGVVIENQSFFLTEHQGLEIPKGTPHRVFNDSSAQVEFILFSAPNLSDRQEI